MLFFFVEEVPADKFYTDEDESKDRWFQDAVSPGPGVGAGVKTFESKIKKWPNEHGCQD